MEEREEEPNRIEFSEIVELVRHHHQLAREEGGRAVEDAVNAIIASQPSCRDSLVLRQAPANEWNIRFLMRLFPDKTLIFGSALDCG